MIPDEEIAEARDRTGMVPTGLSVTPYEFRLIYERTGVLILRLLAERELLVREHRAMLPLVHGDITKGAIDPLFEAWGQVEAFK